MYRGRHWSRSLAALLLVVLAGCAKPPPPAPVAAPAAPPVAQQPVASIVALMSGQIAPAANVLWEAVATVSGPKGNVEKAPHTDKDWAEVRRQALILIEAANLLQVEGRTVLSPGEHYANPPGPGDLTPAKAEALIKSDRASFVAFAQALQAAGLATLKTIDARDATALMESGGGIDEACEACHKKFWYPDGGAPTP